LSGHVQLENVCFRYSSDSPDVLRSINLTIGPDRRLLLLGVPVPAKVRSGDYCWGSLFRRVATISYNGIPLQRMRCQEGAAAIRGSDARYHDFQWTILENLTLNNPTMSREQAMHAAKIAAIHEDIMKMPMAMTRLLAKVAVHYLVGSDQRMAMLVHVAHNPVCCCWMRATSSLDVITEQRVAEHLESFACTQLLLPSPEHDSQS